MTSGLTTLSPRQTFDDNMRPANLLLQVYRLLDCNDVIQTEGELVSALRGLVRANEAEDLMVLYNQVFLGLVREAAMVPHATLRQAGLCHLLRQAVVASCTALETFLPALLRANLPIMIRARGRDFVPHGDAELLDYFRDPQFSLDETLRLIGDENAAEYVSAKILNLANFKYLSTRKGVHVVGALLGLEQPWDAIATHLHSDKKDLIKTLDDTVTRRNDIVHRADRAQSDPTGPVQMITYAWSQHAVDTMNHVCLALDEVAATRIKQIRALMPG